MRTYGQRCPIARASEILAERWTPIILRNLLNDGALSEVCWKDPGFEVDLFVEAESRALAEWHLGRTEWRDALRDGRIGVHGPVSLARALPTWNRRSEATRVRAR